MAGKPMNEQDFLDLCEQEVVSRGLTVEGRMDYDDWRELTGLDDSFVGMPEAGIPGTGDLYDAALRVLDKAEAAASPKP